MNLLNIFSSRQHSIIFVDARISLYEAATINLKPNTEIVFIDLEQDGIKQITQTLANKRSIQRLQIVGLRNGNKTSLQLGLAQFDARTFEAYTEDLSQWRKALSASSEIILYGLDVISEPMLYKFMQQLATITGANVGAFISFADVPKSLDRDPLINA